MPRPKRYKRGKKPCCTLQPTHRKVQEKAHVLTPDTQPLYYWKSELLHFFISNRKFIRYPVCDTFQPLEQEAIEDNLRMY